MSVAAYSMNYGGAINTRTALFWYLYILFQSGVWNVMWEFLSTPTREKLPQAHPVQWHVQTRCEDNQQRELLSLPPTILRASPAVVEDRRRHEHLLEKMWAIMMGPR